MATTVTGTPIVKRQEIAEPLQPGQPDWQFHHRRQCKPLSLVTAAARTSSPTQQPSAATAPATAPRNKTCFDWTRDKFTVLVDLDWTVSAFHRNGDEGRAMVKALHDTANAAADAKAEKKEECSGDPTVFCTIIEHTVYSIPQTIQMDLRNETGAMITQMKSGVTPAPSTSDCLFWLGLGDTVAGAVARDSLHSSVSDPRCLHTSSAVSCLL
ncbi:hypothetical protein HK104_004248 [Borealophlyctis nickersoniae]|nr:hypothetical protein HK104_004248 [Borealophlyctis nickersoniae]